MLDPYSIPCRVCEELGTVVFGFGRSAARGNHLDIVKLLVERGADPKAQNSDGNFPGDEADEEPVMAYLKGITG